MGIKNIINKFSKGLNASITVEASFSFTLTVFILFLMLGPLLIIKTTSDMMVDINEASKIRCNYEMIKYVTEDMRIVKKIKEKIADKNISDKNLHDVEDIINYTVMVGKFSDRYSDKEKEYQNLKFIYERGENVYDVITGVVKYDYEAFFKLPYNLLFVKNIHKRLINNRRAFIGAEGNRFEKSDDDNGEYIYIANNYTNSSVYHTYIDCTYLVKNTFSFHYNELDSQHNENNQKYSKCEYCFRNVKLTDDTFCYGTKYGDKFHYRANCPLMTAYVTKVPMDYIERYNLRLCEKCRKKGEN